MGGGKITAPKVSTKTHECGTSHGKRDFAIVIKFRISDGDIVVLYR